MGLFSGGNSSSSTTNNSNAATTSSADYSQLDGGVQTKGAFDLNNSTTGDISLNMLDGGAIKDSFAFGNNTIDKALTLANEAFRQIGNAGQRETETAMLNVNKAAESKNPDTALAGDLLKYGVIAVVALAVVYAVVKRGK